MEPHPHHALGCLHVLCMQVVEHLGLSGSLVAQIESVASGAALSGQKRTRADPVVELPDGDGAGNAHEVSQLLFETPCFLLGIPCCRPIACCRLQ